MKNLMGKELKLKLKSATMAIDASRVSLRLALESGSHAEISEAHSQLQENIKKSLELLGVYGKA